ncbi:bifunctional adenosylcobinamide kinase/adenosylcobinamide-phosphate guanylyltransferase [Lentisphaera profundi]|uniref:Adenosylcobinamide kinase n=1 Tax=Lentisphaera profundi TaxID=1658616 RepID=A0ABY7VSF1_9BACT|nr:bifunctional adenosylcobinamide kinase/adenosylcobinamide-phosphate guanylyltransferase [Lentisphaera profundi]WDE97128.1 bifunctional adenosylcobinamide kinase/adenosylcobinamide-phosphate guanylyltransferase [Lentisphaera profundi]
MARITFITGGCRSGKSSKAEELCLASSTPHHYLATATAFDDGMKRRIEAHQLQRAEENWNNIEEPLDILKVIKSLKQGSVLVDCLTLWINNLMWEAEQNKIELNESMISERASEIIKAMQESPCDFFVVSNETGMGIMPINAQARLFGDLAGRCNQLFAKSASRAILMVSGLALDLKDV